ncbi:MAG: nitrous oxide reductase accessory protein NosL [Saprospiraceae bacterium]
MTISNDSIKNKVSSLSSILLVTAGACIFGAVFFPIWRIELDAPQYPEGLALLIYANKLGGEVEIINGLNHYIGMKTLHAEEFVEFAILPYIITFFGLAAILTGFIFKSKRSVFILLLSFILFGIIALYDFWKWEYEYGHNLDTSAAIQVPGMAYQPPLLGFKQLLNFGAYSIPDLGGWLMLIGGILIAFVWANESIFKRPKAIILSMMTLLIGLSACSPSGPEPISLHQDICAHCKMNISNGHFAAEMISKKGRIYKFDDIFCLVEFKKSNNDIIGDKYYIQNYLGENELINAEKSAFVKNSSLKSPMGGNIAAFISIVEAKDFLEQSGGELIEASSLLSTN